MDMDTIYNSTISKLPVKEKMEYCENLIDKAQRNLLRNKKHINTDLENQLYTIIVAARTELNKLINEK